MMAEEPPGREFWFGTDAQGRDIYSRVVHGARISLTVGIFAQLINTVIGTALGLSAGYWGGWWDDFVTGLTNLLLAIPSLIFALAIMAILGPGLTSLLIALGLTNWSFTCRLARASALSLQIAGLRAGRESARLQRLPHHADAGPAEHARAADRHRNARHGRHDPRRGRALVPRARHPPALSELGQHAVGGARPDHHRAVALGLPGPRDLPHRARPQPARRRAARHPRSPVAEPRAYDAARGRGSAHRPRGGRHAPRGGGQGQLRDRARRDVRARRRIRLRQVDHGARHHGAAAAPAGDRRRLDPVRRPRHREPRRRRAAPAARQAAGDDLPGADDGAQSAAPGGPPDRRDVHPARRARAGATPSAAPSRCWRACAFRRPSGARATIRISSPAACASA